MIPSAVKYYNSSEEREASLPVGGLVAVPPKRPSRSGGRGLRLRELDVVGGEDAYRATALHRPGPPIALA